ncbi:MAG TPA: hypothetical protein VMD30_10265, partial [Tepidisphaeraceae bacterium]|nr:hypothetical protein [Tepidisphaeraceae bacterium]
MGETRRFTASTTIASQQHGFPVCITLCSVPRPDRAIILEGPAMGLDSEQKFHVENSAEKKSKDNGRAAVEQLEARWLLSAAPGAPNFINFTIQRTESTDSDPVDIQQGYLIDNNTSDVPDLVVTDSNGKKGNTYNTVSVFIGKIDTSGFYDVNGQTDYYSGGENPQGVAIGDLNEATDAYGDFPISELVVANADAIDEEGTFLNQNGVGYIGGGGIAILFGTESLNNNVAYA